MEKFSLADALRLLDDDTQYSESFEHSTEYEHVSEDVDISENVPFTDLLGDGENDGPSYQTLFPVLTNNDTIDTNSKNTDENNNICIQSTESEVTETLVADSNELDESGQETPKRGRGRTRNKEMWKQNVRKRKRQSGEEYESLKGKRVRAREIKTTKDCNGRCKFHCSQTFSKKDRNDIFEQFWDLNDTEKNVFYGNTTDKDLKGSVRTKSETSRRKFSYKFYFRKGTERVRVCKVFYFSPSGDQRGRHVKSKVPDRAIEFIIQHIESYPRVPSHYCRASSSKEYLEKGLSVAKMYEMYGERGNECGENPQPIHIYRKVFTSQFNIGFFKPQKDRCDLCEEFEVSEVWKRCPEYSKDKIPKSPRRQKRYKS